MNASERDLRELAFSTRSRIFETVDSPKAFVVRIFSTPLILMQPLMISSPSATSRGRLSPVRALVFRVELPLDDNAVQRDLFAGLHDDDAADGDLIRVDLLELAVLFDVGVIRDGCPSAH